MPPPPSAAIAQADAKIGRETRGQHRFSLNPRPVIRWHKNEQTPDALTSLSIRLATGLFGDSLDYCLSTTPQIDASRIRHILAQATQAVEWRQIGERDNPDLAAALHQHGLSENDFGPWWRWFPERIRPNAPEIVIDDAFLIRKIPVWLAHWRKGLVQTRATRRGEAAETEISGHKIIDLLEITRSFEGAIAFAPRSDFSMQLIETLALLAESGGGQTHCFSPSKIFGYALDQTASGTISADEISACSAEKSGLEFGLGPEESNPSITAMDASERFRWLGGTVQWGVPGWSCNDYFMKSLAVFAQDFTGQSVLELGTSRGKLAAMLDALGCNITTVDHQDRGAARNLGGLPVNVVLQDVCEFLFKSRDQYRLIVVDLHGNTQTDWERLAPGLLRNLEAGGSLFLHNLNLHEMPDWKQETGVRWFLGQLPTTWAITQHAEQLPGFAIARKPQQQDRPSAKPAHRTPAHKYNVAFCFDNNYQQHFGAALNSLLLNFSGNAEDLCIHVVGDSLDEACLAKIALLRKRFRATIAYYAIDDLNLKLLSELPLNSFYTRATYAGMFLPYILPEEVETVLYLDSDTIVLTDIRSLFEIDLSNKTLAAVSDASSDEMKSHWSTPNYINSGVMLINLPRWRQRDYSQKCIEFSRKNKEKLKYLDQCAVNVILQNDLALLPSKWNVMVQSESSSYAGLDAAILHFITSSKPWQSWYENPLGENYWKYLHVSPWSDAKPVAAKTVAQTASLARLLTRQGKLSEAIAVYQRFKFN